MTHAIDLIKRFSKDTSGVSSVEYALLLALVAGGIVTAAFALGTSVSGEFNEATTCVETSTCG